MDLNQVIKQEYEKGTPVKVISQMTGISRKAVSKRANRMGIKHNGIIQSESPLQEATMPTEEQNQALLDECEKYGINTSDVKHFWFKSKRISMFVVAQNQPTYEEVRDKLIKEMKQYAPVYPTIKREKIIDKHLLVIDPADIHVGKYSVKSETGYHYDMETAVSHTHIGVDGIVQKAQGYPIDQILLVVGNDVLHRDNHTNTTTSGTRQDVHGMWHEAFTAARQMYVEIIERLVQHANVHVVFNPSNHDYVSGYMLIDALYCWFHNHKQVTFDADIKHRKYYQYGQNLIATTHGDGAKNGDMPLLMAHEAPKMWAETRHRYIYQHHLHHRQKINWQSVKDYPGITLEILRTPAPPDGWSHRNGYVGSPQAVEGFIHHKLHGQVAHLTHTL